MSQALKPGTLMFTTGWPVTSTTATTRGTDAGGCHTEAFELTLQAVVPASAA